MDGKFTPCHYCKKTKHVAKTCRYKNKQAYHYDFYNNDGHQENFYQVRKAQENQQPHEDANQAQDLKED